MNDDAQIPDDERLPDAALVRPYVESLDFAPPPPSVELSPSEQPTDLLPRISHSTRRHSPLGRPPQVRTDDDVDTGEDAPKARGKAWLAIAAGAVVVVLIGVYFIWGRGGSAGSADSNAAGAGGPILVAPSGSSAPSGSMPSSPGVDISASPSDSPSVQTSVTPTPSPGSATPATYPKGDLAAGRPIVDTGHSGGNVASNAVDGNPDTYWQGSTGGFPESLTVDLGALTSVGRLVLRLPPLSSWTTRVQTIAIQGSTDGSHFKTIVGAAALTFDPNSGNSATLPLRHRGVWRYVRLTFTANTGWPAGQASEVELFSS